MIYRQVRVPLDHGVARPPAQFLQHMGRCAGLDMPACPRAPSSKRSVRGCRGGGGRAQSQDRETGRTTGYASKPWLRFIATLRYSPNRQQASGRFSKDEIMLEARFPVPVDSHSEGAGYRNPLGCRPDLV